eukprot:scaffold4203_cov166-Ochromonas_danica.AAC.2
MDVGAIGFHDRHAVKRLRIKRDKTIVNALTKTKEERNPDLAELQEQRNAEIRAEKKAETRQRLQEEKNTRREREELAKLQNYSSIMRADHMHSNADMHATKDDSAAKGFEDDFM